MLCPFSYRALQASRNLFTICPKIDNKFKAPANQLLPVNIRLSSTAATELTKNAGPQAGRVEEALDAALCARQQLAGRRI